MSVDNSSTEKFVTLPDHLREGLDLLFVGLNPSQYSAEVGHYFANPRNRFWPAFNLSGLVDRKVAAEDDATLLDDGIADEETLKEIDREVKAVVTEAAEFAQQSPEPDASELYTDVLADA